MQQRDAHRCGGEGRQTLSHRRLLGSLVGVAGVDQRGEQQELRRFVQQDQIVASQAVVVHPAAVYLEGCRVVVLLLVEERGALQ